MLAYCNEEILLWAPYDSFKKDYRNPSTTAQIKPIKKVSAPDTEMNIILPSPKYYFSAIVADRCFSYGFCTCSSYHNGLKAATVNLVWTHV